MTKTIDLGKNNIFEYNEEFLDIVEKKLGRKPNEKDLSNFLMSAIESACKKSHKIVVDEELSMEF